VTPYVFISYARKDAEFALKLGRDLREKGVSIWLDQLDIKLGQHWDRAIEEALEGCACLLVVLSPDSAASENVLDEVGLALDLHKPVVPVRSRACNIPLRLRRLQYIDFTGAEYQVALDRLLASFSELVDQPLQAVGGKKQHIVGQVADFLSHIDKETGTKREVTLITQEGTNREGSWRRTIIVVDEIAAGKESPISDDIFGYIQQTGEFQFEFKGQPLKAEPLPLLRRSSLVFRPAYDYVAVQVSGDSMNQAGILRGDYVILQKAKMVPIIPESRDIVAVVFRGEDNRASLKRILIDPNRVVLRPESSNPEHKPRILLPKDFTGDNPSVTVVGIAIAALRPVS
jgi:hypothetical protein